MQQRRTLYLWTLLASLLSSTLVKGANVTSERFVTRIAMPGFRPASNDQYMCQKLNVERPGFIVKFIPTAIADRVHHMLLYGCTTPGSPSDGPWPCGSVCGAGGSQIIYAWARNAPPLEMPENVSVALGAAVGSSQYLVLQVHYARPLDANVLDYTGVDLVMSPVQTPYLAKIFLYANSQESVPAHAKKLMMNVSCTMSSDEPFYAFAFRTHAHGLGRVISAYKYSKNHWSLVGKGNPQWPQRFYPISPPVQINSGDIVAAQCTYEAMHMDHDTHIGSAGMNEMCNFYMYYYTAAAAINTVDGMCERPRPDTFSFPAEGSEPPPQNKEWEALGAAPTTAFGVAFERKKTKIEKPVRNRRTPQDTNLFALPQPYLRSHGKKANPQYYRYSSDGQSQNDQYSPDAPQPEPPFYDQQNDQFSVDVSNAQPDQPTGDQSAPSSGFNFVPVFDTSPGAGAPLAGSGVAEVANWPPGDNQFGQIGGISADVGGRLFVFHRAERVWDGGSFDGQNVFRQRGYGPIVAETVVVLNASTGAVIRKWGSNLFYLPHDIFVDSKYNVWVTDVAMHQVFRFSVNNRKSPDLILGEAFVPGSDRAHFCKPASVIVTSDGSIYVGDGYCNSRIVLFDPSGQFVNAFGRQSDGNLLADGYPALGTFSIVHSVSADEGRNVLYIADRENKRIQLMGLKNGSFVAQLHPPPMSGPIYAVDYCPEVDTLFAVNGDGGGNQLMRVFAINPDTRGLMYSWTPKTGLFSRPHALATGHSRSESTIFVGEIGPADTRRLWKFILVGNNRKGKAPKLFDLGNMGVSPASVDNKAKPFGLFQSLNSTIATPAQLALIMGSAVGVPLLLALLICVCIRFRKQGGLRAMRAARKKYTKNGGANGTLMSKDRNGMMPLLNGWNKNNKGFQPLSTEDMDAIDDLTEESETEDTLYPVTATKHTSQPLNA